MASLSTLMEIEMVCSIKFIQTVEDILASMRVDDIEKNG
jgi:hypothetical protein